MLCTCMWMDSSVTYTPRPFSHIVTKTCTLFFPPFEPICFITTPCIIRNFECKFGMYRKPSTYSPNALIEERLKEWRSASTTKRSSPISVGDFSRRSRSPSNSDSPLYQHPGLSFRVKYPNRTVSTKWSLYSAGFETKF